MTVFNRVLAFLVSIALAALAVVVTVEVVAVALDKTPVLFDWRPAYDQGFTSTWTDTPVRAICIGLIALGLLILLSQLAPRKPSRLGMKSDVPGLTVGVTRHGLAASAESAAESVDGIGRSTAKVGKRKVAVSARSRHTDEASAKQLEGAVKAAVAVRFDRLKLSRQPKIKVSVRPRKG